MKRKLCENKATFDCDRAPREESGLEEKVQVEREGIQECAYKIKGNTLAGIERCSQHIPLFLHWSKFCSPCKRRVHLHTWRGKEKPSVSPSGVKDPSIFGGDGDI